jgi:hypothetical protein
MVKAVRRLRDMPLKRTGWYATDGGRTFRTPRANSRGRFRTVVTASLILASSSLAACANSNGAAAGTPAAASASSSAARSTTYPNAIAALGHSGTTGANTDPRRPGDNRSNSWVTGDNPAVRSIYQRLLALNPAIRGHNANLGVGGSNVDDLPKQVDQALQLSPLPDLFVIQEIDNDIRCDGTDPDNFRPFADKLAAQVARIVAKAPDARILLVSSPAGTVDNYARIIARLLGPGREANTGTGPCDLFAPSGKAVPAHWRYLDRIVREYQSRVKSVCAQFPTCQYDDGALAGMKLVAADLAFDEQHMSVVGLRKQAQLEWQVLGYGP